MGAPPARLFIEGYGNGGFRLGGGFLPGGRLITPQSHVDWPVASIAALTMADFAPIADRMSIIDVLLIGCGARPLTIPGELRRAIRALGPVVDAMDTGAACRTFNVMVAEGRRVAAALMAVP